MPYLASFSQTAWFALGAIVVFCALVALQIYNAWRIRTLAYPAYEYARKRADEEADRIIAQAREEARKLLERAETESLALTAARKTQEDAAMHAYDDAIKVLQTRLEGRLNTDAKSARDALLSASETATAELKRYSEEARARMEQAYAAIEGEGKKQLDENLSRAFTEARETAAAYERARKEAVDAHITALVGETVKIVLKQDLPREMHVGLAHAALEEAKANHVF